MPMSSTIQRLPTTNVQQQEDDVQEQDCIHASGTFGHEKKGAVQPQEKD